MSCKHSSVISIIMSFIPTCFLNLRLQVEAQTLQNTQVIHQIKRLVLILLLNKLYLKEQYTKFSLVDFTVNTFCCVKS